MKKILFLMMLTNLVRAQIIYSADISNYQAGQSLLGQYGWSEVPYLSTYNNHMQVENFPMSYLNYGTTNKALHYVPNLNTPSQIFANNTTTTEANYYFAFLLNVQSAIITDQITSLDFVQLHSGNNLVFRIMTSGTGNGYQIRFGKMDTEVAPTVLNFNQTYLLVFKYSQNSASLSDDNISLFINPDVSLNEPLPHYTNYSGSDVNSSLAINKIYLTQNNATYNGFKAYISQPKICMNWNDLKNLQALAVNDNKRSENEFRIIENPIKNNILKIKSPDGISDYNIDIYDISGKKIMNNLKMKSEIDISNLKEGEYFLKILEKQEKTLKFLKVR